MIKKIGTTVAVAVAAIVLAGCGGGAAGPTVTVTQDRPSSPSTVMPEPTQSQYIPQPTPQEQYITALKSMGNSYLNGADNAKLIDTGYAVCDAFDQGVSVDELTRYLVNDFTSKGITDQEFYKAVGMIIGASAVYLCPQHRNLV